MFESDCYADDINSLDRVNGVYRTWKDVPTMLWSEYFRKLEKERNSSLRTIFENEFILMKRMYCFLDESQIMGRTLAKLGIPNTCGKINKTFLRQPGKKRELNNFKKSHGKSYIKNVLKHKKISFKKPAPKQNLVKMKPPRYAPVVERCSDIALKRQRTENNIKFPSEELYTFSSEENRKPELINKQECNSDQTPLKYNTNSQPIKQRQNFKIIGLDKNKLVKPTKINIMSQPSLLKMCLNSGSKRITELNYLVPLPSPNTINLKSDESLQNKEIKGNSKKIVRFNDHDLCSFAPSETYSESPQTQELGKKDTDKVITDVLTNNLHSSNNSISNNSKQTNKEVNNKGKSIETHTENTTDNPQLFEKSDVGKDSNFEIEPYEDNNVIIEESSNSSTSYFLEVHEAEENQTCNEDDRKKSGPANEISNLTEKTNNDIVSKTVYEQILPNTKNDDQILILDTEEQSIYDNSADNSLNKDITVVIEETPSEENEISEGIEEVKTCTMKLSDQITNFNKQSPPTNNQTHSLSPPKNINDLTQIINNDWSDDEYAHCSMTSSPEQVKGHIFYSKGLAHTENQPCTEEAVYNTFKEVTNDNDSCSSASLSDREYISERSDNEGNEIIEHSCTTIQPIHESHEEVNLDKHTDNLTTPMNFKPKPQEYSHGEDKDSKCTNAPIKASRESVEPSLLHTGELKMTKKSVIDINYDDQNTKNIQIRKALFPNQNKICVNENDPYSKEDGYYLIATNSFKVTTTNETTTRSTTKTNNVDIFEINNKKLENSVASKGFAATNADYITSNNISYIKNELIHGNNYRSKRDEIDNNLLRNNNPSSISQTSLLSKDTVLNTNISIANVVQEKEPVCINKVQYQNEAVMLRDCKMNEPNHTGNKSNYSTDLQDNSYIPISPEPLHYKNNSEELNIEYHTVNEPDHTGNTGNYSTDLQYNSYIPISPEPMQYRNNSEEKNIVNHTNNTLKNVDKTVVPEALRNNTAYQISETNLNSKDISLNNYISLKSVVQVSEPIRINEAHYHNGANINKTNSNDNAKYGAEIYDNSYTPISLESLQYKNNSEEKNITNHTNNTLNNIDKTVVPNSLKNHKAYHISKTNLNITDAALDNCILLKNVFQVKEPIRINDVHCHKNANINKPNDNANYGAEIYDDSYTPISPEPLHSRNNSDEQSIVNQENNTSNNVVIEVVSKTLKNDKAYPISETKLNSKDAALNNCILLKNVFQVNKPKQTNEVHCHNEASIHLSGNIKEPNYASNKGADLYNDSVTPLSLELSHSKYNSDEQNIANQTNNTSKNVDKIVVPNALRNNIAYPVSETNLNSKGTALHESISLKNVVQDNGPIQINNVHFLNDADINETNDNANYGAEIYDGAYTPIFPEPLHYKNNSDEKNVINYTNNTLNNGDKKVALKNDKGYHISETNSNNKDKALNNCILFTNVFQVKELLQINEVHCQNEANLHNLQSSGNIKEPNYTSNYGADLYNDSYTPLSLELCPSKDNSDEQIIINHINNFDKTVAQVHFDNTDLLTEQPEILRDNTIPERQENGSILTLTMNKKSQLSPVNKSNWYNISTEKKECSYSHVLTKNSIKIYNNIKEKHFKKEISPNISDLNFSEEKITTSQTFKQNMDEIKNSNLVRPKDLFIFEQKQQPKQPDENLEHRKIIREKKQCQKEPLPQSTMLVPQVEIRDIDISDDGKGSNVPKNIDVNNTQYEDNFTNITNFDDQLATGQSKIPCSNPVNNQTTASKLRFANSNVISKKYQLLKQNKTFKDIQKYVEMTSPIKITNFPQSFSTFNYKTQPKVDKKKTPSTNKECKKKRNIFLCTDTQLKVKSQTETLAGKLRKNKQKNTDLRLKTCTDSISGLKTQRVVLSPNKRSNKGLVKCMAQTKVVSACGEKNSNSLSSTNSLTNKYCTTVKVFPVVGETESNKTRLIEDKENVNAHGQSTGYVSTISKNIVASTRRFKEHNGNHYLYYKTDSNETQAKDKTESCSKSFVTNNKQNSKESSTKSVNKKITGYENLEDMPFGNMSDDDYSLSSFSLSGDSNDFKTNSSPKGHLSPYNSPAFGHISSEDLPELSKYETKRKKRVHELDCLSDFESPKKLMKEQNLFNKQPKVPVNRKASSLDFSAFEQTTATYRNQMPSHNKKDEKKINIENVYSENTNSFRTESPSSLMSDEFYVPVLNSPSSDKENRVVNKTYLTEMFDEESSSSFRSWLSTGISVSEDY